MPRRAAVLLACCSLAAAHLVVGAAQGATQPPAQQRQCSESDDPALRLRGGGCAPVGGLTGLLRDARSWNPILLAFIGTSFGWLMTALGSAAVVVHSFGLSEASYRKAPPLPL